MDGVAGLEGRFRKIESCGESLFVHVGVMIADGGVWFGGAERVNALSLKESRVEFLPVAILRCIIFSSLLMVC